ncbi:hypothetical protein BDV37DRAFT_246283 [Aspergillus pseudonomiae]|uniref:Uncharacterized protein n=1 Tax=Aspergillus pseudonomiae TaxID=1506151 RepID=A0A5N7DFL7_9EURO|nr:uncharacterized protein BDV37DRAFT_246283 [Aspergillus pseudonomiae]KAE8405054.1 hypothetical protein BDV37DRAFT_246283 [Aspergillus pseudonomiae]
MGLSRHTTKPVFCDRCADNLQNHTYSEVAAVSLHQCVFHIGSLAETAHIAVNISTNWVGEM